MESKVGSLLKQARESSKISQVEMAEKLGVTPKTYRGYENDDFGEIISVDRLKKAANICGVNPCHLLGCRNDLDDIFYPYFEILKNFSLNDEREQIEAEIITEMISIINAKIANHLVETLLEKVSEIPIFDKFIKMIIMNDVGATVRIWSIIEQASQNDSEITAKEKLIQAAQKGYVLVLPSQAERDFLAKFVESWSDEMCNYLLQNSQIFIDILKKISKQAESAISSNEKILKFIRRFSKSI